MKISKILGSVLVIFTLLICGCSENKIIENIENSESIEYSNIEQQNFNHKNANDIIRDMASILGLNDSEIQQGKISYLEGHNINLDDYWNIQGYSVQKIRISSDNIGNLLDNIDSYGWDKLEVFEGSAAYSIDNVLCNVYYIFEDKSSDYTIIINCSDIK